MEAKARLENQEKWMSDEVRVLVGTLAFGLGINKAAVRSVIHLSLPKRVEQYYQEAGATRWCASGLHSAVAEEGPGTPCILHWADWECCRTRALVAALSRSRTV